MMDTTLNQFLVNNKAQNELGRHPLAASLGLSGKRGPSGFMVKPDGQTMGIPSLGEGNSGTGFQDLVAMAQAQAEAKAAALTEEAEAARSAARELAQLRAMGLQNDMLAGMISLDQGGESDASALVSRTNLESLMMSGSYGNLLGQPRSKSAAVEVSDFTSPELSSYLKAGRLGKSTPGRQSARGVEIMGARDTNSRMPYGLPPRPPKPSAAKAEAGPENDLWIEDPLKSAANELKEQGYWIEDPLKAAGTPAAAGAADAAGHWYDQPLQKAADRLSKLADVARNISGPLKSESEIISAQKADARGLSADDELSRQDLDKLVDKVALALDMDPNLVRAVIKTESNFNHKAVSKAGAKGLMQLMPGTAKDLGVKDPFNPVENVWAGARYLKKMLDRNNGNLNNALASYNWGPGNFERKGKAQMPGETRRYISIVNQHYAKFRKENQA